MADVRIQYFGTIRLAAQRIEDEAALAGDATVFRLLLQLADAYGEGFRGEVLAESGGMLRDDLMVTVNGTIINHAAAGEIVLRPGDIVALFPTFPGGG